MILLVVLSVIANNLPSGKNEILKMQKTEIRCRSLTQCWAVDKFNDESFNFI